MFLGVTARDVYTAYVLSVLSDYGYCLLFFFAPPLSGPRKKKVKLCAAVLGIQTPKLTWNLV